MAWLACFSRTLFLRFKTTEISISAKQSRVFTSWDAADWMQREERWVSTRYIWVHNLFFLTECRQFWQVYFILFLTSLIPLLIRLLSEWRSAKHEGRDSSFTPGASYFLVLYLCLWEEEAAVLCGASLLPVLASAAPVSAPFLGVLVAVLWLEVPVATCEKRKTWECAISLGFIVITDPNQTASSFWNLFRFSLHFYSLFW